MLAPHHPYRSPDSLPPPRRDAIDRICAPRRVAKYFVIGWSLLRVAVGVVHGVDAELFVALGLVLACAMPQGLQGHVERLARRWSLVRSLWMARVLDTM